MVKDTDIRVIEEKEKKLHEGELRLSFFMDADSLLWYN